VLRQLSRFVRCLLSAIVIVAGLGYVMTVAMAYLAITPPSTLFPDIREFDRVVFKSRRNPPSLIERLLEATDGPMNRRGSMRSAFTDQSVGWEELTQTMTAEEKAVVMTEREGERLAVLAWVHSGPSQEAYESDDFQLNVTFGTCPITAKYLITEERPLDQRAQKHVRIRSILADRCATCHGENGRNEHAQWIPLDTFEAIERKCRPEDDTNPHSIWLIASLAGLLPLVLLIGPLYCFTNTPLQSRRFVTIPTVAALIVTIVCSLLGRQGSYSVYLLLGAAVVTTVGAMIQGTAILTELLTKKQA
jgi:hypothetical protein